jgi:signal transduction histidine kinase/CheY-like chemotaxis protein/HPt (histidine-containing phosphotransfer) domain-containing protein
MSDKKPGPLLGLSFSVIDLEYLVQEVGSRKSEDDRQFIDLSVETIGTDGQPLVIYSYGHNNAGAPYESVETSRLGDLSVVWRYKPSQAFVERHGSFSSYIIFMALSALALALIIFRQMSATMRLLKASREKAEDLSRMKSDFLATMSHEIRTPMNGILGMAELILSAHPEKQIENYARTIIGSGETLLSIINDILDFSKIEAGKMQIDLMDVDMLELVDDLAILHSVKARDKAVELVVRYMPGTERFVYADPLRIRQILGNLLSNAIKFTDEGHITILVEEDPSAVKDPERVALKFSVRDTGIGLSEETQQKIFEKFTQADSSTTRKYGGTGLGLSISKSLVKLMGGQIGVESREGEGATFWFSIMMDRNLEKPATRFHSSILEDVRILVVDDLPVIRELLSEQLQDCGMRPYAAKGGHEALKLLRQAASIKDPYRIAIIDYLMPDMNGEVLAQVIQNEEDLKDTCLVMLTAAGNPIADDEFSAKGFSAYISKPVQTKALIDALAIIWSQYSAETRSGHTKKLIRLDPQSRLGGREGSEAPQNLGGKKILLVEDNLVNQIFIREILEEMHCKYKIVPNGKEAVAAVCEEDFDLVLMDCLMPVMDGYEATREIRKLQESGTIKPALTIIALTANAMKGDRERCVEAGMDDYISKPVRKQALENLLSEWLDEKPRSSETSGGEEPQKETKPETRRAADVVPLNRQGTGILDAEAVENARSVLKADYAAMVHIFVQNCYERYEEMEGALGANDITSLIRPAHTLKSTSRQMGAVQMGETARRIEYAAKDLSGQDHIISADDLKPIRMDMKTLLRQIEEARTALEKVAA